MDDPLWDVIRFKEQWKTRKCTVDKLLLCNFEKVLYSAFEYILPRIFYKMCSRGEICKRFESNSFSTVQTFASILIIRNICSCQFGDGLKMVLVDS